MYSLQFLKTRKEPSGYVQFAIPQSTQERHGQKYTHIHMGTEMNK